MKRIDKLEERFDEIVKTWNDNWTDVNGRLDRVIVRSDKLAATQQKINAVVLARLDKLCEDSIPVLRDKVHRDIEDRVFADALRTKVQERIEKMLGENDHSFNCYSVHACKCDCWKADANKLLDDLTNPK